ncbi:MULTISPECIES: hypothetical protein [Bacillaceae]|uniref:hypothetical protein n=1 Tax=Bacillaceae TaxID=186817 RepID=UPI001E4D28B8|nr:MULTISPECIES: hypothetical protein [Bacillaceae]MCE4049454.1 hypothetical protein [Bacillus sp. Au-Bac7]MCM3029715.1 hypothetical protein [Niallia sp. MER 6]MDL0437270.1 hypothetical protein [Niallia sp. SS-2023]UPO87240.1 hypothetical protein L8T27_017030 [Niallia sp. Man26]
MNSSENMSDLLSALISMQAKTLKKMEQQNVRIRQLEYVIQEEFSKTQRSLPTL